MRIDFFAGNFITGKIKSQSMYFATNEEVEAHKESVIDELLDAVGWEHGLWAMYTDGKSENHHAKDFGQYIGHYRKTATA